MDTAHAIELIIVLLGFLQLAAVHHAIGLVVRLICVYHASVHVRVFLHRFVWFVVFRPLFGVVLVRPVPVRQRCVRLVVKRYIRL